MGRENGGASEEVGQSLIKWPCVFCLINLLFIRSQIGCFVVGGREGASDLWQYKSGMKEKELK